MFADFSLKWFALYYPIFGMLLFGSGIALMVKPGRVKEYLTDRARHEKPPPLLRNILKYYFLFSLPCLLFSFFPFSWPELLFSVWSLVIVYVAGIQLVRWPQTRGYIEEHPNEMYTLAFRAGAIMLAVSPVMFLLSYIVIRKLTT